MTLRADGDVLEVWNYFRWASFVVCKEWTRGNERQRMGKKEGEEVEDDEDCFELSRSKECQAQSKAQYQKSDGGLEQEGCGGGEKGVSQSPSPSHG